MALLAGLGCGCGPVMAPHIHRLADLDHEAVDDSVSDLLGAVTIDGSSTVFPIAEAAAADFKKVFPQIKVDVGLSGTGGGFEKFARGETDISNASRPVKREERDKLRQARIDFLEIPVAYDGIAIVVHPSNDWIAEDTITVDQIKAIFQGDATTWQAVDPAWPNLPLKIQMPDEQSGTYDYFDEVVAGKDGHLRGDGTMSSDDNSLVTGVAGDRGAIGFFGASYYFQNQDKIKALKVVNPQSGQAVPALPETIESGEYAPFSRPLLIYVKATSALRPEVKAFLTNFFDHPAAIVGGAKLVPLPQDVYQIARATFESGRTGTHFLDGQGTSRSGSLVEIYTPENLTP